MADDEVVVEARRSDGPDPLATPASVTVIAIDEHLATSADLGAVLEQAPGANVERLGGLGDWSGVTIRGSTMRQVLVALDGVPLNPDGASVINLSELPLQAFERVEVYRGSVPAELGGAPVGGAINLVTGERPPPLALEAMGGSFGTSRGFASGGLRGELGDEPADVLAVAEVFRTRGDFSYFDDDGTTYNLIDDSFRTRENNDKLQGTLHLRARVGDEHLRLTLLDALTLRDEGLAGVADAPAVQARLATARNLGVAQLSASNDEMRAVARAWGWQRAEQYDDRMGEIGAGSQWTQDQAASWGVLGDLRRAWGSKAISEITTLLRRDTWSSLDLLEGDADGPRGRLVGGLTLSGALWLDQGRVALQPKLVGLVLDDTDLDGPSGQVSVIDPVDTTTRTHLDPWLGALWRPRPWLVLKGNAGTALRPPDLSELFGDRGVMVGNPELVPERSRTADLGLRVEAPEDGRLPGSAELTAFATRTRDLIAYVQTGQRVMVPINLGDTRVMGLEGALDWGLGGWLESRTALTWTYSENLSKDPEYTGKQLPRVPAWDLSQSTALVREGRLSARLGHTFSLVDGDYLDAVNVERAAPRAVHGAFLRLGYPARGLSLELDALNLANRRAEVVARNPVNAADPSRALVAITDLSGYPLPGRSLLLSLRWSPEEKK